MTEMTEKVYRMELPDSENSFSFGVLAGIFSASLCGIYKFKDYI